MAAGDSSDASSSSLSKTIGVFKQQMLPTPFHWNLSEYSSYEMNICKVMKLWHSAILFYFLCNSDAHT